MNNVAPIEHSSLRDRMAKGARDARLRVSLSSATTSLERRKSLSYGQFEDPAGLRETARAMKAEVLLCLPELLERLSDRLADVGAQVHWAKDASEATEIVLRIGRQHGVRQVVKSKSMLSEEISLNPALEQAGILVTETDLGEWIVQLAGEAPSHIIVPAVHKDREQIHEVLQRVADGDLGSAPEELVAFARRTLRERFLAADMGISGVNFAVANTGTLILVTNEGNGRMTTSIPRVHVALLGMERIVETWEQLDVMLALLTRAATGQPITTYVSAITGPRNGEFEGPDELHVVIVDNGRSTILGSEFSEMLACVRCGACLNACPVYRVAGGHSYGWVYPGPMGAVLTPLLLQTKRSGEVPYASSLCGACWQACPVGIPLQDMLLALRRRQTHESSFIQRLAWNAWATVWSHPVVYRASLKGALLASRLAHLTRLPPVRRWVLERDPPAIPRESFRDLWRKQR